MCIRDSSPTDPGVMGCFPTAAPKVAPPLNSKSSLSARESLKKNAGFRAFISHMKLEGAMEARFLQTELESHLKEHCFLDSDDLEHFDRLFHALQAIRSNTGRLPFKLLGDLTGKQNGLASVPSEPL